MVLVNRPGEPPMPTNSAPRPLIGVTGCAKRIDGGDYHTVGDKYLTAVSLGANAHPVVIGALGDAAQAGHFDFETLLPRLDGLLVTGSPSNVEPHRYDGVASRPGTLHDPARDATTLPLIRAAIARGLPTLAICRGLQELNVAYGGTLHQRLQDVPGKRDHRMPKTDDLDVRYGPRHPITITPHGPLAAIAQAAGEDPAHVMVNSLHAQAIDRPADGLAIEALSEDGVVEAVRVENATAFALGVQWHPEYKVADYPLSLALFAAFGAACHAQMTGN